MSTATQQTNDAGAANGSAPAASVVPDWLQADLFEEVLKSSVPGYKKVINFKAKPALAAGENYATIMLRVEIEVALEDGKTKTVPYMLKIAHDLPIFKEMAKTHNIFDIETDMYQTIVPELEQIYRDAGVEVKFGAQSFRLKTETDHVLLEDLRPRGFKNTNRLEGLDMDHTKCVLKKLAQWHAASAVRVATKGMYSDQYVTGFFTEEHRAIFDQMNAAMMKPFLQCIKSYQGHEYYLDAVLNLQSKITDEIFKMNKYDPNEFNALNHGDCWSNNIMFQYDAFGKIKETYFVDYQIPRYVSPAMDLLYFLISSTKLELKIKQFEYFIKFYHDNLVENLMLLKYPKKLPLLREIHAALYKYGLWGYSTACGVMGAVLLDPNDNASFENFLGESEAGTDFKLAMYSNARYRKHIEAVLPWLHNRGALE